MFKYQQGAILVIALLIVSIITALAIDFSSRFQLSIGRADNRIAASRVQQCVFSIEAAVNWGLLEDRKENESDHFGSEEKWADPIVREQLEAYAATDACKDVDGVNLYLEDAQGRFNLNLLANNRDGPIDTGKPFEERYNANEKRFIRLLQAVEENLVSVDEAQQITEAVVDWADSDNAVSGSGGAESDFYLSEDKPYRAANQSFVSVTELRLVRGMTDAIYTAIEPYVVALPDSQVGININTAPIEVMRALNLRTAPEPLPLEDAQTLESSRPLKKDGVIVDDPLQNGQSNQPDKGHAEVKDFLDSSEFVQVFGVPERGPPSGPPGSPPPPNNLPAPEGLTTETQYFLLTAEVEIDKVIRRSYSMLRRKTEPRTNAYRMHTVRRGTESVF